LREFLNVIEPVFSRMARAPLHNNSYSRVEEARAAIDRYFEHLNRHLLRYPRRAGTESGEKNVLSLILSSNSCEKSRYR
jgi:hypothetical protein